MLQLPHHKFDIQCMLNWTVSLELWRIAMDRCVYYKKTKPLHWIVALSKHSSCERKNMVNCKHKNAFFCFCSAVPFFSQKNKQSFVSSIFLSYILVLTVFVVAMQFFLYFESVCVYLIFQLVRSAPGFLLGL